MTEQTLHFDISSGLKSVLGSELITDDEVAVFELVKNSFDANATHVDLSFSKDRIVISDNGIGMTYEDIQAKWLFVAYSAKRNNTKSGGFRDGIAERKHFAGSKGVGRFSSDRLGKLIVLETRPKSDPSGPVHRVEVDWDLFDSNHQVHFENIEVQYSTGGSLFSLPEGQEQIAHGTVISIERTRKAWGRDAILRLKSALAKLINPFGASADGFTIAISAPAELAEDQRAKSKDYEVPQNRIVNGAVGNFIFSTLQEKTTYLEVKIEPSGLIESILIDRGELIYHIQEPNHYEHLANSGFRCQLYFLNTSAKTTFTRRMGVPSVQFGSIFLFRNGFRVFPVGEEGNDWYGIDRRKQQGYSRFLGTRDVIGKIDVSGSDQDFQESSSRNTGLIETKAVVQLRKCFVEHCLKRLERYVVPVTFVDKEDRLTGDISRLDTDPGRARVASAVAKLVDSDEIELIAYSKRLIGILNERSSHFEASLASLRSIADKTHDEELLQNIAEAEKKFLELRRSQEEAVRQADEERAAKEAAQVRAQRAEEVASIAVVQLEEEKKRNLFLASIATLDTETILNLHHQITIYAVDIQQQIENFLVRISGTDTLPTKDAVDAIELISLLNKKVMGVSKFATKANFRLESEKIDASLSDFLEQYVNDVARDFLLGKIVASVVSDGKGFTQKFKPIDISVVVDNLIANARKARAHHITFTITHPNRNSIHILVKDDGRGFSRDIHDLSRIFEKGFTTTDGSGLGLFHVKRVLNEMNGTIEAQQTEEGSSFLIRISK